MGKLEAKVHRSSLPDDQKTRIYDAIVDFYDREAKKLSSHYDLECARVRAILEKTAYLPDILDPGEQLEFIQKYGPIFRPHLAEVLEFFPPKEALELLESDKLPQIQKSLIWLEGLLWDYMLYYTLDELQRVTASFICHLERNREHLINTGYPAMSFEECKYLETQLGKLYYVKLPSEDLMDGLNPGGVARLEAMRGKLFNHLPGLLVTCVPLPDSELGVEVLMNKHTQTPLLPPPNGQREE